MKGTEQPCLGKYKDIKNDWIYGISSMLASFLVLDLQLANFNWFLLQSVIFFSMMCQCVSFFNIPFRNFLNRRQGWECVLLQYIRKYQRLLLSRIQC
jgi:hypothetical protein